MVSLIVGTRPDAIKMAPLIRELKKRDSLAVRVVSTGQHRDLVGPALAEFGVRPDADLSVMRPGQPLATLVARLLEALGAEFGRTPPTWVLGHGDTATCFAAALAAFYRHIPFGHVEAGLRSRDLSSPFPEEFHRQVVARHSFHHFAPDEGARRNLLVEGVPETHISVTGNTLHDALEAVLKTPASESPSAAPGIVVTWHRREGRGFLANLKKAAGRHPHVRFYFPVHPSPRVKRQVYGELSHLANVELMPPLNYSGFITLLSRSRAVLTDSGGVQEEAGMLGKPTLLARDRTERPLENGAMLVGRAAEGLPDLVTQVLASPGSIRRIAGGAARKIADIVTTRLVAG